MSEVYAQNSYSLPYGYSDNRIVLLAKDPNWLYAYWEISESRRMEFINEFGQKLWDKSIPVIKVTNISNNTAFYIRINELTNNWYINVPDSDSLYVAELGRQVSEQFFINLVSSNCVVTPGAAASANTGSYFINYKNLRSGKFDPDTGEIYEYHSYKAHTAHMSGISSPELIRTDLQQSSSGVSSAELLGINLGISSTSFIL